MPYNINFDECLFTKSWQNSTDRITVSIYSYNKGAKKLQITRETINKEGELRFAKLGRMTKEEIIAILPLIQEAIKNLE